MHVLLCWYLLACRKVELSTGNKGLVTMYQVTAIYEGCEIGFGQGDSLDYAIEECIESIDSMYTSDYDVIRFVDLQVTGQKPSSLIPKFIDLKDVINKPRMYF